MNQTPKAILVRAAKTFFQAFLGSITVTMAATNTPNTTAAYRALFVGAIAAGISALVNLYIQPVEAK